MMTCVAGSTAGLKENKLKVTISILMILMTKHKIKARTLKLSKKLFSQEVVNMESEQPRKIGVYMQMDFK